MTPDLNPARRSISTLTATSTRNEAPAKRQERFVGEPGTGTPHCQMLLMPVTQPQTQGDQDHAFGQRIDSDQNPNRKDCRRRIE